MATDIKLTDLTDGYLDANNEWQGNGVFDKLMYAVNKNIEGQYIKGRITGNDYAKVYLGGLESVIAQSIEYILREKQVEAQTDLLITQKIEAELDGASRRALEATQKSEMELNGAKDRELKDNQIANLQKDLLVKNAEIDKIVADTGRIESDTALIDQQKSELIANGVKDRALKDSQKDKVDADTALITQQKNELIANGTKDRLVKDKQIAKLESEKQFIDEQKSELTLNGTATRNVKAKEAVVKEKQADLLVRQKDAITEGLIKDLLKEASGGYAMVYEAVSPANIPGTWAEFDRITNKLLSQLGTGLQVSVNIADTTS